MRKPKDFVDPKPLGGDDGSVPDPVEARPPAPRFGYYVYFPKDVGSSTKVGPFESMRVEPSGVLFVGKVQVRKVGSETFRELGGVWSAWPPGTWAAVHWEEIRHG